MFERPESRESVPRIVIGGGESDKIPALVTEYSIKARCDDADVIQTHDLDRPMMLVHRNPTLFSLVRWWIPQLCGFKGRAIYLDSDMVLQTDITELYNTPMKTRAVLRTSDPSVMLIDCGHVGVKHWDAWKIRDAVDDGSMRYHGMWGSTNFTALEHLGALDDAWNHRDQYEQGVTKNLHYTALSRQPWRVGSEHPHEHVWTHELLAAIDNGFIKAQDLPLSPFYENMIKMVERVAPDRLEKYRGLFPKVK